MTERTVIRSYRRVFRIERRVYRVDRWMLPVPGGVSLWAIGYYLGSLLLVIFASNFPPTAWLVNLLNPPLRYVVLPGAIAWFGTQATPDGRVALRFGWSWVALRVRRAVAWLRARPVRWSMRTVVAWDVDSPILRRSRVMGPAHVRFHHPVELRHGRGRMIARRGRGEPCDVVDTRGVEIR